MLFSFLSGLAALARPKVKVPWTSPAVHASHAFHPCIMVRHIPCSPRVPLYAGYWKTVSGVKVRFPDLSHADLTQTASH